MISERSAVTQPIWLALWPLYVLLLEYLAISAAFDAKPLLEVAGSAHGFGYLGILAPALVVVATATYVLCGPALRGELRQLLCAAPVFGSSRRLGLSLNVLGFLGLWLLVSRTFAQLGRGLAPDIAWLLALLAAAAISAGALLSVLFPAPALRRLLPAARRALGLGALTGVLAWTAGVASEQLWQYLQAATLHTVLALMLPFSNQLVFGPEDALIGTEQFVVQVAPECSGVEGIGLISVVMTAYLVSARQRLRFPRALALLPAAIALVFLGNAARIALLIAVGVNGSPEVALSGFHSKAGWLFFCAIALSLIAFVQRSRFFAHSPTTQAAPESVRTWNPVATYLLPLLALIASSLVTGLFADGFDRFYGLRIAAMYVAWATQRAHLPRPSWPASWHAPLIGFAVFGLWIWLVPSQPTAAGAALRAHVDALGSPWAGIWLALRALGAVLAVPVAEELAFRGFLLRRLIARDFSAVDPTRVTPWAVLGSSIAFAALHPGAALAAALAGAAYALAQRWRGRLADAIVAHAVTNACIAFEVLVHGRYELWL